MNNLESLFSAVSPYVYSEDKNKNHNETNKKISRRLVNVRMAGRTGQYVEGLEKANDVQATR